MMDKKDSRRRGGFTMMDKVAALPLASLKGYERGYSDALKSVDRLLTELLEAEQEVSGEWLVAQVRGMKEGFKLFKEEMKTQLIKTLEELEL
jgi:hypothetical protein